MDSAVVTIVVRKPTVLDARRNEDLEAAIEAEHDLALDLFEYTIHHDAVPAEARDLDHLQVRRGVPLLWPFVTKNIHDPWGTIWRLIPDPRREQDVALDVNGTHYEFRGSTRFHLQSAGRDRTHGTGDDVVVDAFGRLWQFPAGVRLDAALRGRVQNLSESRASVVADAISDFVADHGCPYRFPVTIDELRMDGYLNAQLAVDGWGRPWIYRVGPDAGEFTLRSPGSDGVWNTSDDIDGGERIGCQSGPGPSPQ